MLQWSEKSSTVFISGTGRSLLKKVKRKIFDRFYFRNRAKPFKERAKRIKSLTYVHLLSWWFLKGHWINRRVVLFYIHTIRLQKLSRMKYVQFEYQSHTPEYRKECPLRGSTSNSSIYPLGPMIGQCPVAWNKWEQSNGTPVRWSML
jgi:hypothetical protein